jgi:Meckel syndrome type 1 protein
MVNRMPAVLRTATAMLLLASLPAAHALEIGALVPGSRLGEPLAATITVGLGAGEALAAGCVTVTGTGAGLPSVPEIRAATDTVVGPATARIRVSSLRPLTEPAYGITVRVSCPGATAMAREFVLLPDLPGAAPAAPPMVSTLPVPGEPRAAPAARPGPPAEVLPVPATAGATAETPAPSVTAGRGRASAALPSGSRYLVQPGETLWSIAVRATGAGGSPAATAAAIRAANPQAFIAGDAARLMAGATLVIPAGTVTAPDGTARPAAAPNATATARVAPGDSPPRNASGPDLTADGTPAMAASGAEAEGADPAPGPEPATGPVRVAGEPVPASAPAGAAGTARPLAAGDAAAALLAALPATAPVTPAATSPATARPAAAPDTANAAQSPAPGPRPRPVRPPAAAPARPSQSADADPVTSALAGTAFGLLLSSGLWWHGPRRTRPQPAASARTASVAAPVVVATQARAVTDTSITVSFEPLPARVATAAGTPEVTPDLLGTSSAGPGEAPAPAVHARAADDITAELEELFNTAPGERAPGDATLRAPWAPATGLIDLPALAEHGDTDAHQAQSLRDVLALLERDYEEEWTGNRPGPAAGQASPDATPTSPLRRLG